MLTSPSLPCPLITVTPKSFALNSFASNSLFSLRSIKTLTTTLPIAIVDSIYDPEIVPAANPNA